MYKYIAMGLINTAIAVAFGLRSTVVVSLVSESGVGSGPMPNVTSAGAACGFAVAAGLCFIASAICEKKKKD